MIQAQLKLVLLSDTHTMHDQVKVPDGDVLIHAGDLTYTGRRDQFEAAIAWLSKLPHKHKLVIAGNHDFGAVEFFQKAFPTLDKSIHYLHETGITIDGIKFWGSPYTPTFGRWAYMADRGEEIKKHWDLIPTDTDVLITHGPLWGILDVSGFPGSTENLGCEELHNAVFDRVLPQVHVFGHIHGSYGRKFKMIPNDVPNILFYNASVVNEDYEVVNSPWEVDIRSK